MISVTPSFAAPQEATEPLTRRAIDDTGDRFTIRPLDDPPFYSEFVLIEPSRRAMSEAAALFASILKAEAEGAGEVFAARITTAPAAATAPKRRQKSK